MQDRVLIAVVGPTASGKTELALELARSHRGEIVSCDSLQVYRRLDIGSAKATREERDEIPHHLIDILDPDAHFSAAEYSRLARQAVRHISQRGQLPIVAGGTGLYLKALLLGLFEGPSRDPALRRRLEAIAERRGDARLHRLLVRWDPEAAARIQPRDRLRVVRAIEVHWRTGRPLSRHHDRAPEPLKGYATLTLGLAPERSELRARVERRSRLMLEQGLLAEVEALLADGFSADLRPLQAIGYRQALGVIQGQLSVEAAEREIVTETMRYAKRQMTWFRHQAEVRWFTDATRALEVAAGWLSSRDGAVASP